MLTKIAREWLGTPWKHHQAKKQIGCDCVGFLMAVAEEAGLNLPPIPKPYPRLPKENDIKQYLDANFILSETILLDSILLLDFHGISCHVAIATSENTMIHADSKIKEVIEHRIDDLWLKKIKSIYTIKPESYNNA